MTRTSIAATASVVVALVASAGCGGHDDRAKTEADARQAAGADGGRFDLVGAGPRRAETPATPVPPAEREAAEARHDAIPSPLASVQREPRTRNAAHARVRDRQLVVSGGLELGRASADGMVTDLDWRLDEIEVHAQGVGLRDVTVTWTSGASFVAPEPSRSSRPIGLVGIETYDDPSIAHPKVRHTVPGSAYRDAVLTLLPTAGHGALRLRGSGLAPDVRGAVTTGRRPSLHLTGLPRGTVDVTVQTYGAVGPLILASIGICTRHPPRERFIAVAHTTDGAVLQDVGGKVASDCPPNRYQVAADADAS